MSESVDSSRVTVAGDSPYDVVVGTGVLAAVADALVEPCTVAVVTSAAGPVAPLAARVAAELRSAGFLTVDVVVPDGERAKTVGSLSACWDAFAAAGMTRSDAVVTVGGGAITDLGGFAAATWLRGVRVVHVPTTLLAMVDAAVGGKTGVNVEAGKNLVGAFHPPIGVVCDLDVLATLPREELASGLAEVVKTGFIADQRILDLLEARGGASVDAANPDLPELVARSVAVKARVVGADLRESGLREILNYGHTLGHAIEQRERYTWRHGDAVSVGMCFAAWLSSYAGSLPERDVLRHIELLRSLGLPTTYARDAWPELRATMALDKKARGARLRFVVLDTIGHARVLDSPPEAALVAAYDRIAATA